MAAVFPTTVADWIYTNVLTDRYRSAVGAEHRGTASVRVCSCQWGMCGECQNRGNHDRCTTRRSAAGRGSGQPYGYLNGVAVWPTGRACSWRCPCPCPQPTVPTAIDAVPVAELDGQLPLFAVPAGAC